MAKKWLLRLLPYITAITAGIFFYLSAKIVREGITYDLLINVSAAFFVIPLVYLFYETIKFFSHKKLNKEILDYTKMQIDREILFILNQLLKIVYPFEEKSLSNKTINIFLSLQNNEIGIKLRDNRYLGFQIFKNWEPVEKNLHEILRNPFIINNLEDEEIISIIELIKSIRQLEDIQKIDKLYLDTKEKAEGYKIVNGMEMNPENKILPDRCLLLKEIGRDKFVVQDFGDIPKYSLDKCLNFYTVNCNLLKDYISVIANILVNVNRWLDLTGHEFVIDTRDFRPTKGSQNIPTEKL